MINTIMVVIITIATIISGSVGYFTLTRLKSTKREFFVLFTFCVFIYELGYILEMTAQTADGGLVATKIMYAGSEFIAPLFLVFVQKYCEIKLSRFINTLLFISAVAVVLLVWTSEYHTLYYTAYWYDNISQVHHLGIKGGVLYSFGIFHPVVCIVISLGILIKKRRDSEPEKRKRLSIFFFCSFAPIVSHVLYFFDLNVFGANYAPLFLMVTMVGLYLGLIKFDLLENEETIRSQNWLKEMIGNVSHDLKTPLTILGQYLELLDDGSVVLDDTERSEYTHVAYNKNLNMQRLIRNLFEATRIETGQLVYKLEWKLLSELLTDIEDRHGKYLRDLGLRFTVRLTYDCRVWLDIDKIWSVFDNIIYNAARHTSKNGEIIITTANDGCRCVINISDTGEGIAQEHLTHIFDRFYKVSKARSESGGDSGIGLYIVKTVTEGMGGSISVQSCVGKGTIFSISFKAEA